MAALIILSVLMGMIYASLAGILSTDDALSRELRVREAGTTLMSIMNADLRAFMFYNYGFAYFAGHNEGGEGLPGSSLSFSALNYDISEDASPYDLVGKVSYSLAEDGTFMRTLESVADYDGAAPPSDQALYTGVANFVVQFSGEEEWVDDWEYDPEEFECPRRVRIQLALVPEDERDAEAVVFSQEVAMTTYALAGEEDDTRSLIRREPSPEQGTTEDPTGSTTDDEGPPPIPDEDLQPPTFPDLQGGDS
jgi:hypothetical protein